MTRLTAVDGATVAGPTMIRLACTCIVDEDGAVWSPCPAIYPAHTRAVELVRFGGRGALTPLLDAIRAHVRARAPMPMGEQGALL